MQLTIRGSGVAKQLMAIVAAALLASVDGSAVGVDVDVVQTRINIGPEGGRWFLTNPRFVSSQKILVAIVRGSNTPDEKHRRELVAYKLDAGNDATVLYSIPDVWQFECVSIEGRIHLLCQRRNDTLALATLSGEVLSESDLGLKTIHMMSVSRGDDGGSVVALRNMIPSTKQFKLSVVELTTLRIVREFKGFQVYGVANRDFSDFMLVQQKSVRDRTLPFRISMYAIDTVRDSRAWDVPDPFFPMALSCDGTCAYGKLIHDDGKVRLAKWEFRKSMLTEIVPDLVGAVEVITSPDDPQTILFQGLLRQDDAPNESRYDFYIYDGSLTALKCPAAIPSSGISSWAIGSNQVVTVVNDSEGTAVVGFGTLRD